MINGLTDVTEFKLTNGTKAYLSAIIDLYDNSIVSYVLRHSNNNKLVVDTFNLAIEKIQMQAHYFIVIEDFNIQVKHLS
jgi:transposase InsO family protein